MNKIVQEFGQLLRDDPEIAWVGIVILRVPQ